MTAIRTARGTNATKNGALTLTISDVTIAAPAMLHCAIGYDSGSGEPVSVKWGRHILNERIANADFGVVCRQYGKEILGTESRTHDLVFTWETTAPTAKAAFATQWANAYRPDRKSGAGQSASGSPSTGTSLETRFRGEAFIGAMVSEGPSSDAAGTPSNSWTAGQRIGTVGAPPVSNVTIQEIYFIQADNDVTQTVEGAITGATARDWSSTLTTYRQPNSQRDIDEAYMNEQFRNFQDAGAALEAQNMTVTVFDTGVTVTSTLDDLSVDIQEN